MRNYRTGLFTDDVIPAPLNEAFLGISRGVTTLQHNQSPGHIAARPAIWRTDPYQDWTRFATSKQTMIYQDTPRFVGWRYFTLDSVCEGFP